MIKNVIETDMTLTSHPVTLGDTAAIATHDGFLRVINPDEGFSKYRAITKKSIDSNGNEYDLYEAIYVPPIILNNKIFYTSETGSIFSNQNNLDSIPGGIKFKKSNNSSSYELTTSTEKNFYYYIEKSNDLRDWNIIEEILGDGRTIKVKIEPKLQNKQNSFFRLKSF